MKQFILLGMIALLSFHIGDAMPVVSGHHEAADTSLTHHYTQVNGIRLHYVTCGSGPAVVLLHGWPFTWMEWQQVMVLLAKAGYTAIAPDLRGMGDSQITDTGYSKVNVAEDIHQLVNQLGFKTIRMVGTDIGMMVAYPYAVAHENEITQLVLGESLIPGFGLEELMNPATGGYWHFGFHAQAGLAAMLIAGKEAAYLNPMYQMMSFGNHIPPATIAEYIRQYSKPGAMKAGFMHYATMIADGKTNRARFKGKLQLPVLAVNGEKGIPSAQTFAGIHQVAAHVTTVLVPNSGHALGEDNPEWFTRRLIQFFKNGQ
ncbi:alpha/beta fold hydrolase [Chitinophaga arvensicola]|uniref:Pimeloyl-ACP methyl ester carboxylesterase n=1 Tax=Chitinophaga arvensicola TaxID=29529 RepID=A0A1I0RU47_9BACT|nr:alpha/beta hydrolase [Chitinophaga arvensicola]SEW44847.1 Pimeloyl-ACP methyl ester carboxylesterase [Chitinophaga arvensicola]